jgi:transglutaminase-like putative cysteine protease
MKKILVTLILTALILAHSATMVLADTDAITIHILNGTVNLQVGDENYSQLKAVVIKDGKRCIYNVYSSETTLPLQMGDGIYQIKLYKNVGGIRYKELKSVTANVDLDEVDVYLQDIQYVPIGNSPNVISKALEITSAASNITSIDTLKESILEESIDNTIEASKELILEETSSVMNKAMIKETNDMAKLKKVYDYVVKNIEYDTDLVNTLDSRYLPNAEKTLTSKKGICYDYASLTAVMLRSLDIPTKLVKGYSTNTFTYHSWNEVYIGGKWLIVDTTVDASLLKAGIMANIIKSFDDYNKIYEF